MSSTELDNIKVFVVHVASQTEREMSIRRQLDPLDIDYRFVLDGDCADLTDEIIKKYFVMSDKWSTPKGPLPRISCAFKHFLSLRYIIDEGLEGALILEDDIELHGNFLSGFIQSIREWKAEHYDEAMVANYEDSSLKLVPRSKRRKGKMLYQAQRDRFGGCYFVSRKAAEAILDYVCKYKMDLPNDLFLTKLTEKGIIKYYWSHSCLATQGSFTGSLSSTLSSKKDRMIRVRWKLKSSYKKLLYWFR